MNATIRSSARSLKSRIPGAMVLIALGGIAWWGHANGWRAPSFSSLLSGPAAEETEDWCEAHRVPRSKCISCNPELAGKDPKDWCREHGLPESKCVFCHPEILKGGQAADWCAEHGVPESQCTLCNPDVAQKGAPASEPSDREVVGPEARPAGDNSPACPLHELRIQFASEEAIRKAGIRLEVVQQRPMAEFVSAAGEIQYDQDRIARVSPRASGTVSSLEKSLGEHVEKGEVLALIDSAETGRARTALLQSIAGREARELALKRIETSTESGFRTRGEVEEASAELRKTRIDVLAAQQTLWNLGIPVRMEELSGLGEEKLAEDVRFLGIPGTLRERLRGEVLTANLLPLSTPISGTVVAREAVAGESVEPTKPIFVIADTSRVWAALNVRLEDARSLALGQAVIFRPDGASDNAVDGKLTWIGTAVDEKTRTVQARAELENSDGRLLARTFGSARIRVRESPAAVAVPSDAVQWEGCCHIVFVRTGPEVFQTRKVRLGARSGEHREVLVGVLPGEVVATTGSAILKSEILKSRLGAGCAGE